MSTTLLHATRAVLSVLVCLLSASVTQAGTITSASTVTVPNTVSASTTIGPQTLQISFSNPSSASRTLNFQLLVTGASFVTSATAALTITGSSGLGTAADICTTEFFTDKIIVKCTPTGSTTLSGLTMDVSYTNAAATLSTNNGAIKLSGTLSSTAFGTYEDIASKSVVLGSQRGGSTNTIVRQGAAYSTSQSSALSLVRLYNGGATAGTATVALIDLLTGETLVTWTSPSIPAGAALQYSISTLEAASTSGFTKPDYYNLSIQSGFSGTFQHVLYRPSDGVLSNLTICDSAITAPARRVANVHTARLAANGFPSTVAIYNTGSAAQTATLSLTDARDGTTLGSAYTTAVIPASGGLVLPVSTIESGASVTPTTDQLHYVITVQDSFTGYLQHRVNNQKAGVITDMSTACTFSATP
jgi:hypothetical protein